MHIFLILFFYVQKNSKAPSETLEFSAFFTYQLASAQHLSSQAHPSIPSTDTI